MATTASKLQRAVYLLLASSNLAVLPLARADEPTPPAPARQGYADSGRTSEAAGGPQFSRPASASETVKSGPISAPASVLNPNSEQLGSDVQLVPIDLPYSLRMVNASNPTIAIARERVQEATARLKEARVLWIPNLWLGGNPDNATFLPNFYVHRGNIQNARGDVFDTVKSNAAFSAGTGFNLSVSDAVFVPRIARDLTAAEAARARAVTYNVQLDVALTYLDLLEVYGALAINAEMTAKVQLMTDYAVQAQKQGLGKTTADANRAQTELERRRRERIDLLGRAAVVSARLAQLLLLEASADFVPADKAIVPIELVPANQGVNELIAVGLLNRPELAESRAQISAALTRWRQDKTRPLFPTIQMAYYGAEFGGGNPGIHDYDSRNDFYVQASFVLRNGGLGNVFQARESRSRFEQANLRVTEVQAQVAADVSAAVKMVRAHDQALKHAQEAVRQAEEMWIRLSKAAFGLAGPARQYDPLEPLLAEQALFEARTQYLTEVIGFNREQFRLYWSMGQPPESSLPCAQALTVTPSVLPTPTGSSSGTQIPSGRQ